MRHLALMTLLCLGGCSMPLQDHLGKYSPEASVGFSGWNTNSATINTKDAITLDWPGSGPQLGAVRFGAPWGQEFPIPLQQGVDYRFYGSFRWVGPSALPDSGLSFTVFFNVGHHVDPIPDTNDQTTVEVDINEGWEVVHSFHIDFTSVGSDGIHRFDALVVQVTDLNAGEHVQLEFTQMRVTTPPVLPLGRLQRVHIQPRDAD